MKYLPNVYFTDEERIQLVKEVSNLIADNSYRSPDLYALLEKSCKRLMCIFNYRIIIDEDRLDFVILYVITGCIRKLPKYDIEHAVKSFAEKGNPYTTARGIEKYLSVITKSLLIDAQRNIAVIRKHLDLFVPFETVFRFNYDDECGNDDTVDHVSCCYNSTTYVSDIACSSNVLDIDNAIDEEAAAQRAKECNRRIDMIEALHRKKYND